MSKSKRYFMKMGILTDILDWDNIRYGLSKDLKFSRKEREENIMRVVEVAKLFYDVCVCVLISFISTFEKEKIYVRELIGKDFVEIFVSCPLEICEQRYLNGLYKKLGKDLFSSSQELMVLMKNQEFLKLLLTLINFP